MWVIKDNLISKILIDFAFQLGKAYGIESYVLSPAETKDLYPLMNVKDLYGTLYVPKDGTMDPAGTCTTLSRAATARGATVRLHTLYFFKWCLSYSICKLMQHRGNYCVVSQWSGLSYDWMYEPYWYVYHWLQVIENCPVTGIQVKVDDLGVKRVKAVETAHGTIQTPCVVNCAGQNNADFTSRGQSVIAKCHLTQVQNISHL